MARVLVACEFSATVRDAFRARGHDAWSCDLLPTTGDPAYHIVGDALAAVAQGGWDLLIAHPPCTYLALSGVRWLYGGKGTTVDPVRWAAMERGAAFFKALLEADVPRVAVENPMMHGHALRLIGAQPGTSIQTVQPWQHGHPESKATRLWLRRLPPLTPTKVLTKPDSGHWDNQTPSGQNKLTPSADRWAERSKTYDGIAAAMADQWGARL